MPGQLDNLQGIATRLINDFGGPAVLSTISHTFDPATGKTTDTIDSKSVIATPPEPYTVARRHGNQEHGPFDADQGRRAIAAGG